jgi:hypothetical protein
MTGKWLYYGDVNRSEYGGTDMRHVGARRFQFVELINMEEHGARETKGDPKYVVELSLVDLDAISPETIASAVRSCGSDEDATSDVAIAEMCKSYGAAAPLDSYSGNNWHKLMREARRDAQTYARDSAALDEKMSRPVNAIGSTAAEYMRGDLDSAITRGLASGNKDAQIMAKMQDAATIDCPACYGADPECDTCKGRGKVVQTLGGLQPAR